MYTYSTLDRACTLRSMNKLGIKQDIKSHKINHLSCDLIYYIPRQKNKIYISKPNISPKGSQSYVLELAAGEKKKYEAKKKQM